MTLIELLMGLLVASIVACIVLLALSALGSAQARRMDARRGEDMAWLALAAIAGDLERGDAWHFCAVASQCGMHTRRYHAPSLVTGNAPDAPVWIADGTLRRCERQCQPFADGVQALDAVADVPGDVVRREPFASWHVGVRVLEVRLTLSDGRTFSRVVTRP